MNKPEDLDWSTLAAITHGYIQYALADQDRQREQAPNFVITEDSPHNEFLNRRCFYPGLHRHVAREMQSNKYDNRIKSLVSAVVAKALTEEGSLQDWSKAETGGRRDANIGRQQARMAKKYLSDAISIDQHSKSNDARQATISTVFDQTSETKWHSGEYPEPDIMDWLDAPKKRFKDALDWIEVNGLILGTYPETLRVWGLVREQVHMAISRLSNGTREKSIKAQTLVHPLAVTVLANHVSSILVNDWWRSKGPDLQEALLRTPRVFNYTKHDAEAAGKLWLELAEKDPEWGRYGSILLQRASIGLVRWDTEREAGLPLGIAADMKGLNDIQRGHLLENAAIHFRRVNRISDFETHMRRSLAAFDETLDNYRRVLSRINLAESLGGPAGNQEASQLLLAALELSADDPMILTAFWRNVYAMHHRLGDEPREEAAIEGLSPFFDQCVPQTVDGARGRMIEFNQRMEWRPLEPAAALMPDAELVRTV